jgi:hypothetical protein
VVPSASAASSPRSAAWVASSPAFTSRPSAHPSTGSSADRSCRRHGAQARGQSSVSRCPRRVRSGAPSARRPRRARETAPVAQWGIDLHHGRWLLFDAGILPGGMGSPEKVPPSAVHFHTP